MSTGATGLTALAGLTDQPMTVAFGDLTAADHTFTARRVLAGTSIEDSQRDVLSGNVLSRAGNALTVGGIRMDRRDGRFGFERGTATVTVGANTLVTREGQSSGSFGIGDISVGQHIEVMGVAATGSAGAVTVDATAGRVRLAYTRVFGTVKSKAAGALTVALQGIDGREPSQFNFAVPAPAGAGCRSGELRSGHGHTGYSLCGRWSLCPPVRVRAAFGAAPRFRAESLVDYSAARSVLVMSWGQNGSMSPFPAISATGVTVDLAPTVLRGSLELGGRLIDVHTLNTGLALVPASQGNMMFAIAHRASGRVENFSAFGDLTTKLSSSLTGSTAVLRVVGNGQFNATTGAFSASQLLVVLSD